MPNLGGREQITALKSFRRNVEKKHRRHVTELDLVKLWVYSGLSVQWRMAYSKNQQNNGK